MATPRKPGTVARAARGSVIDREVALKRQRLAREGRADIALITRRRARITEDFYDVGEALVRLKRPGVAAALGRASFAALCETDLGFSSAKAEQLIGIVSRVRRGDAVRFGQERTAALLALADATPEDDTPAMLERATIKLPSGDTLVVSKASARELRDAAKALRARRSPGAHGGRGRSATPGERVEAAALEARLRAAGFARATAVAIATRPGQGSDVRISGVPIADLARLAAVLAPRRKAARR